jgi:hypothetical protein
MTDRLLSVRTMSQNGIVQTVQCTALFFYLRQNDCPMSNFSVDRLSGLQLAAQALVAQVREKHRFIHVLDPNLHVTQSQSDSLVVLINYVDTKAKCRHLKN